MVSGVPRSLGVRPGEGRDGRGAAGLIGRTAAGAALASCARSALRWCGGEGRRRSKLARGVAANGRRLERLRDLLFRPDHADPTGAVATARRRCLGADSPSTLRRSAPVLVSDLPAAPIESAWTRPPRPPRLLSSLIFPVHPPPFPSCSFFTPNPARHPPFSSLLGCHPPDPSPQWLGERGRADGTPQHGVHAARRVAGPGHELRGVERLPTSSILSGGWCSILSSPQDTPEDTPGNVGRHSTPVLVHVDQAARPLTGPRGPDGTSPGWSTWTRGYLALLGQHQALRARPIPNETGTPWSTWTRRHLSPSRPADFRTDAS